MGERNRQKAKTRKSNDRRRKKIIKEKGQTAT